MEQSREPTWGKSWGQPPVRWVAHVDMDAFFASVEQRDKPELRGLPVIVANSPMSNERLQELALEIQKLVYRPEFIRGVRGVVASASYEAREFGVRSAMPLAKALSLCPEAVVLPGNFDRYRAVAEHLRRIWSEFSPVVEPMSLDEAYLDMTGCELYGGPVRGIGERLKARIREETGLTASVGLAAGKLMAKIASDLDKPDGLVVVQPGDEARTLAPLPVRAIPGIGPRTAEALYALGIGTIGRLAEYSESRLAAIFGVEQAASLIARAQGIDHSPVEPPGDPKSISRETTLVEDQCDLEELRSVLRVLSDQVGWQLRKEGFRARCIYIKLRLLPTKRTSSGFGRVITRRVTISAATDSGQAIYNAAASLLESAAQTTGLGSGQERVRLLGVGTASLASTTSSKGDSLYSVDEHGQGVMLLEPEPDIEPDTPDAARDSRLNAGVDAVRERFGFKAITLGAGVKRPDLDWQEGLTEF